ncbi:monooxygenase [Kutzneria viridogrisea]|uniref:2-polyprenyl-6-methoxyphenol hydroxylase-like FAD-dependent oxidoreductase n=2 Tax=Kutzneria TaxID=43356 RepID=A0ABR6BJU2_9PSEU|nr:FAD-dependent monooxygenase [Kutzneria albida]AHH95652.1 putative aromatic compound monooxygenase yhjG [Kutzneria albida DSM 43870]MBA8926985.1 2-polyprenyl-6-methoxyphenol hydroxylase-like FAD-dependent oxidoreductase [Kutzneria viridogrisea]
MNAEVVVAGGGPVGLMTAALLNAAGVSVLVLEKLDRPTTQSRATTLHPRSLEVFSALPGLAERLIELGRPVSGTHFAVLPDLLDLTGLDTRYPFTLLVPQVRTERLLAEHLATSGVVVLRGTEVTGLEQDAEGVRVLAGGQVHHGRYLVGADGAHSAVRKLAGIEFPGREPTMCGFLADVELAEAPPRTHQWRHDTGWLSAVRLTDGVHRLFGAEPGDTGLSPEQVRERQAEPLTEGELRAVLRRVVGTDFGLRAVHWTSRANDSTRHAATFRSGRVLLAGDAAHVHLPAGGQGLNVGLQDATNLAWKLAAELRGWAPEGLLDSYDAERRPIAEKLAANTLAQSALMTTFTPAGGALRDLVSGLIADGTLTSELAGWISGIAVRYPAPPGAHPLVGARWPEAIGLPVDRMTKVDFTPDHRLGWRPARPWQGLAAAVIRPDGHVAQAWDSAEDALSQLGNLAGTG